MKKLLSIVLIAIMAFISGCGAKPQEQEHQTSVYSWNRELFDDLSVMEQLKDYRVDIVYQGFHFESDEIETLVSGLRKSGIETVALFGDPSWQNADEVIEWTLKPLIEYNKRVSKDARIEKANYDIEWYLNENSAEAFADYVSMMAAVCAEAHENDIQIILCVPYWLPTVSTDLFKQLISQADEISVMNYAVGREAENLSDICALASEVGVKVESAFETQPVGGDITENITYAPKGKNGVLKAAEELRGRCDVSIAYHHLTTLLELK